MSSIAPENTEHIELNNIKSTTTTNTTTVTIKVTKEDQNMKQKEHVLQIGFLIKQNKI